jgi:hypothetical protein
MSTQQEKEASLRALLLKQRDASGSVSRKRPRNPDDTPSPGAYHSSEGESGGEDTPDALAEREKRLKSTVKELESKTHSNVPNSEAVFRNGNHRNGSHSRGSKHVPQQQAIEKQSKQSNAKKDRWDSDSNSDSDSDGETKPNILETPMPGESKGPVENGNSEGSSTADVDKVEGEGGALDKGRAETGSSLEELHEIFGKGGAIESGVVIEEKMVTVTKSPRSLKTEAEEAAKEVHRGAILNGVMLNGLMFNGVMLNIVSVSCF